MADICCLIYYAISTIQSLPTIARIIRYKQSTDISLISTYLGLIASTAWAIYIALTEQTMLVYIGTVWDMLVCIVYTIAVIAYHDDNPFRKHKISRGIKLSGLAVITSKRRNDSLRANDLSENYPEALGEEEPPFNLPGSRDITQETGTAVQPCGDENKHDGDKVRLDLVEPSLINAVGRVRTFGVKKYPDEQSWRKVSKQRYIAATMRHFEAYRSGELLDPESGLPHLWHVACNIMFLIELEKK